MILELGKTLNAAVIKNWLTSLGGFLAGVPPIILAEFPDLSAQHKHWLAVCSGVGLVLMGVAAKQFNNHSTAAQVEQATLASKAAAGIPTAPDVKEVMGEPEPKR